MSASPTPSSRRRRGKQSADERTAASGRLLLRMAPELHAELAGAAEQAGTSLNQFINDVLASAVGTGDPGAEDGQGDRRVSRSVAFALVANVVVVGVAAAAAIVLIVLALTS